MSRRAPGREEPTPDAPSKSQRKREAHELERLGVRLAALKPEELALLPLAEPLQEALAEYRTLKSHGALLRQRQYIGKLMRHAEVPAIRQALESKDATQKEATRRFHRLEAWRDRLIEEGEPALEALLSAHPGLDREALEGLIAEAKRERAQGETPRAARLLFAHLRSALTKPATEAG